MAQDDTDTGMVRNPAASDADTRTPGRGQQSAYSRLGFSVLYTRAPRMLEELHGPTVTEALANVSRN